MSFIYFCCFFLLGNDRVLILDQLPNVMGVKAVGKNMGKGWNPCKDNNGGCSHLCLNKPNNKYICACQMGELMPNSIFIFFNLPELCIKLNDSSSVLFFRLNVFILRLLVKLMKGKFVGKIL